MSRKIFNIGEELVAAPLDHRLKNWLVIDECVQMRKIVNGLIAKHAALSAELKFNSVEHPPMAEESEAELKKAKDYQTFLNVLEELTAKKDSFFSVKISPI